MGPSRQLGSWDQRECCSFQKSGRLGRGGGVGSSVREGLESWFSSWMRALQSPSVVGQGTWARKALAQDTVDLTPTWTGRREAGRSPLFGWDKEVWTGGHMVLSGAISPCWVTHTGLQSDTACRSKQAPHQVPLPERKPPVLASHQCPWPGRAQKALLQVAVPVVPRAGGSWSVWREDVHALLQDELHHLVLEHHGHGHAGPLCLRP